MEGVLPWPGCAGTRQLPEWATKTARRVTARGWGVKESAAFRAPSCRLIRYPRTDPHWSARSGELRKRASPGVYRSGRSGAAQAPPPERVGAPKKSARRDGVRFGILAGWRDHRSYREGHRAERAAEDGPGARGGASSCTHRGRSRELVINAGQACVRSRDRASSRLPILWRFEAWPAWGTWGRDASCAGVKRLP